jgi:hypothetical protein
LFDLGEVELEEAVKPCEEFLAASEELSQPMLGRDTKPQAIIPLSEAD